MSMSSENTIHIKLDYLEALKAKKNILSSEMGSLNAAKRIERYRAIRLEELGLKARLYGKMKEIRLKIKELQNLLPNPKIPKIIKRGKLREEGHREAESRPHSDGDIESQLREIQRRLMELQGENV